MNGQEMSRKVKKGQESARRSNTAWIDSEVAGCARTFSLVIFPFTTRIWKPLSFPHKNFFLLFLRVVSGLIYFLCRIIRRLGYLFLLIFETLVFKTWIKWCMTVSFVVVPEYLFNRFTLGFNYIYYNYLTLIICIWWLMNGFDNNIHLVQGAVPPP